MKRQPGEKLKFFRSFLAHPTKVGAVVPTSKRTVCRMLDLADLSRARCVVEFGAGTGVYTGEILKRLGPDGRVLAFEVDPMFARLLVERFEDHRLHIVNDSAENVESYLDGTRADVIVSALPFTSLPRTVAQNIFSLVGAVLAPGGAMLVLQYSTLLQRDLKQSFTAVSRCASLLNLPPAFLFACRSPVDTVGRG